MKRNICFITTTRAEYGLFKPLIKSIQDNNNYNLVLIISGTHLLEEFGNSYKEIDSDFENSIKISIMEKDMNIFNIMSNVFSVFPIKLKEIMVDNKIDLAIVLGDRFEIFAISQVLFILGIKICHLAGGDETKGAIDDEFRNSLSQLSSYHMPFSEKAKDKLLKMNINEKNIFMIGNPGLEVLKNYKPNITKEVLFKKYNFSNNYIFTVFHPETKRNDNYIESYFNNLKDISKKHSLNIVIIKPNCDPDYSKIIENISSTKLDNFLIIDNLKRDEYLDVAYHSEFYIGNSSSGIYELPYLKIPIINVGERQDGRELATNITCCDYNNLLKTVKYVIENKEKILENIEYFYKIYESTNKFNYSLKKIFIN